MPLESWKTVWRAACQVEQDGGGLFVTDAGLAALETALKADDARLLQGATTCPPCLASVRDWPIEGADLFGFIGWQAHGLTSVGEAEEFFCAACFAVDQFLEEPAVVRYLLNWFDDTPRHEMRRLLLDEIALERDRRSMLRGCAGDVQQQQVVEKV